MMRADSLVQQQRKSLLLSTLFSRVTLADIFISSGFALFALIYYLGRWGGGYPFVYLSGDAGNIASFAAALDYPELFDGDEVLSDQRNFRIYSTIHIPIIRVLGSVTGDYGFAFVSLLGFHVFFQALGFYILGRVVFQNRYWATVLAVITLMPVYITLGEFWGIKRDPIPRFTFQALLPYVLAAAFHWRSRPVVWPWLLGIAGSLMYVHPVSAPPWGLALWLGFCAYLPRSWTFQKRMGYMLLSATIFLLAASPFVLHYLENHAHGVPQGAEYDQIYEVMSIHLGDFLDVRAALTNFLLNEVRSGRWVFWALGVGCTPVVLWLRREDRKSALFVLLWLAGILIASVMIPLTEQAVARAYRLIPVELDLIRGIRYTIPIMLLFCLWPLAEITERLERANARRLAARKVYAIGGILAAIWTIWHPPERIGSALLCWTRGKIVCMREWRGEVLEALEAVRLQTPPRSRILATAHSTKYSLAIRYYAHRPVVYALKDGGILAYTNQAELLRWHERYKEVSAIDAEKDPRAKLEGFIAVSRKLRAEYLLIDFVPDPDVAHTSDAVIIWANQTFALLKV